eukprot:6870415-Prymnesium_polylepis.2
MAFSHLLVLHALAPLSASLIPVRCARASPQRGRRNPRAALLPRRISCTHSGGSGPGSISPLIDTYLVPEAPQGA